MAGPYGPGQTGAVQALEFYAAAGTLTLPLYRGGDAVRRQRDVAISGTYASGDERPTKDVPRRFHGFSRAGGWSRRPPGLDQTVDWDGFADVQDMCLRFGYGVPSGEQTAVPAIATSWGQPQRIVPWNGDVWIVFLNRIAYVPAGTGNLTDYYSNSGDQFTDAKVWNGSLRVALLCSHANPNQHFFVTITPSGGGYAAALNPTPAAPAGTGATASTPQCRLFARAFWEYQGTGAYRLIGQTSDTQFKYMVTPDGDPYDQANWSAATRVGESSFEIRQLVSSHDTVWAVKQDGVFAITDKNAAAGGENITPYWGDQLDADATSAVGYYWQSQLIVARPNSIEAIDVNSWQVQDAPRAIGINHGRPDDVARGRYTALCSENGWLLAAQVNQAGEARVAYGTPRRRESATAGVTEYDWFPEIGPISGREITALAVHTPEATLRPYLWIGLADSNGYPYLIRVDLIRGTSPLADAGHRYQTSASVTLTDEHWAARSAQKGALRGTIAVRNVDAAAGRTAGIFFAAGAGTAFPAQPQIVVNDGTETEDFGLPTLRGHTLRTKIGLTSTATVPVVLDELELRANLGFPLLRRGAWLVELSDLREGDDLPSGDDRDETRGALVALCESVEAFSALCDDGETRTIVLDNVLTWRDEERSDAEAKVTVVEIRYSEVAA